MHLNSGVVHIGTVGLSQQKRYAFKHIMLVSSAKGCRIMQNNLGKQIQWSNEVESLLLFRVRRVHLLDDLAHGRSDEPVRLAFQDVLS